MVENIEYKLREINLKKLFNRILAHKKLFIINLSIALVVSAFLILCVPRFYVCEVKLAPETSTPNIGVLGSLASSFGLNMSNIANQDAIVPELYPDLMESADFQTSMFPIKVKSNKGDINTTYYDYLEKYQKSPWWEKIIGGIKNLFKDKDADGGNGNTKVNPFKMTKTQNDIAKLVGQKIKCSVDKKTSVITINVEDQDPLICATIADSARVKLQQFIIKYRTNKARIDLEYTQNLYKEAKRQYERARQIYASYSDANQDLVLESFKAKQEDLENEMQLQYNNYQQISQQLQLAKAKLQERTPAFTTLQSASVPLKPTGPKRMVFVVFCMFITFIGTSIYVFKKDI